jgi:hypothetical protein
MLVDTLIDAEWLLRRFRVVEAQLWEQGAQFALKPEPEIELAKALRDNAEYFTRLQRRIDTAQRNYRNALQELQHLQAENRPLPDPEPAPQSARPAPPRNRPVTPANGFVPKADPQNPTESQSSPSPRVVSPDRDLVL